MTDAHGPELPEGWTRLASVRPLGWSLLLLSLAVTGGCASYQVGAQSLFSPDVRTVYVPIIESNSLRRNLGERMTEAVVKEIEKQTPYKVVSAENADSILSAKITKTSKRIVVNNGYDDGRNNQFTFDVIVSWIDRRGDIIRREQALPIDPQAARILESANFIPEFGQSVATAEQKAIERTAAQIVAMMETPW